LATEWLGSLIPVLLGIILSWQIGRVYAQAHRPYALWWTVSYALIALAALTQCIALPAGGFGPFDYRAYLALSAVVPGFMGAGTVYLVWRRFGPIFLGAMVLCSLLALLGAVTTPLHTALLRDVMASSATVSKVAPSALLTLGFALLGAFGGAAMVLGSLYSYWRSRRLQTLMIALGGIVFALAGTLGQFGHGALFFPAQIVGMLLLYFGVAGSRELPVRVQAERSA